MNDKKGIYFISDTHFGQWFANWFFKRPFKNVADMDEQIIKNWNEVVSKDDVIIIVGDFYAGNSRFLRELLDSLNGEKILVKGNHDFSYRYRRLIKEGRIEVYDRLDLQHKDLEIILTHAALPFVGKNTINIHGHYHRKLRPLNLNDKHYYNVCVEHNDYRPVALQEILSHYYRLDEWYEIVQSFLGQIRNRRTLNKAYLLA